MFSHLLLERAASHCGSQWRSMRPAMIREVVIDSRFAVENGVFIAFKGENRDGHDFIPQLLEKGVFCVGEMDSFHNEKYIKVPSSLEFLQQLSRERIALKGSLTIVALSGSSGKTTTRELIVAGLMSHATMVHSTTGNLNNHIGLPLTILALPLFCDVAVFEMGMNHAKELSLLAEIAQPDIGLLTNIGFAHIGNFDSIEKLAAAKLELLEGSRGVIYRSDDQWMSVWVKNEASDEVVLYPFEMPRSFSDSLADLPQFMAENSVTAYQTLKLLLPRISLDEVGAIARRKKLPKYRGEIVVQGERHFVMDCYNANPDSMKKSIDSFISIYEKSDKPLYLVLGEMGELGKFSEYFHQELVMYLKSLKVLSRVFLVGKEFEKLRGAILEAENVKLIPALGDLSAMLPQSGVFLLKGSRSNALERLVEQKEL